LFIFCVHKFRIKPNIPQITKITPNIDNGNLIISGIDRVREMVIILHPITNIAISNGKFLIKNSTSFSPYYYYFEYKAIFLELQQSYEINSEFVRNGLILVVQLPIIGLRGRAYI